MNKHKQEICKPYIISNGHFYVVCMSVHWIKSNTIISRYRLEIPVALHLIRSAFRNIKDQYTIVGKFRITVAVGFIWLATVAYFGKLK
jgi:hypothetical protein